MRAIYSAHKLPIAIMLAALGVALSPFPTSAAGLGQTCGGRSNLSCNAGMWCSYSFGCGADVQGVCRKRNLSMACDAIFIPRCGCDGKTYGSDCDLEDSVIKLRHGGPCETKR